MIAQEEEDHLLRFRIGAHGRRDAKQIEQRIVAGSSIDHGIERSWRV